MDMYTVKFNRHFKHGRHIKDGYHFYLFRSCVEICNLKRVNNYF